MLKFSLSKNLLSPFFLGLLGTSVLVIQSLKFCMDVTYNDKIFGVMTSFLTISSAI